MNDDPVVDEEKIEEAIHSSLLIPEGWILNRYIVIAEGIRQSDGVPDIFVRDAPGMTEWDGRGMILKADEILQTAGEEAEEE